MRTKHIAYAICLMANVSLVQTAMFTTAVAADAQVQKKAPQKFPSAPGKNRFLKVNIGVTDMPKALSFYVGTLGLHENYRYEPGNGLIEEYLSYDKDPLSPAINLVYGGSAGAHPPGTGNSSIALVVQDLRGLCDKIVKAGGKIKHPPQDVRDPSVSFDGAIAFVEDPFGNAIELLEQR